MTDYDRFKFWKYYVDMSTISETDIDQLAASQLSAINQRYTKNRRQLIEILLKTSKPITINQILESDSKLAQSSVYRNLAVLEEAGLVVKISPTMTMLTMN